MHLQEPRTAVPNLDPLLGRYGSAGHKAHILPEGAGPRSAPPYAPTRRTPCGQAAPRRRGAPAAGNEAEKRICYVRGFWRRQPAGLTCRSRIFADSGKLIGGVTALRSDAQLPYNATSAEVRISGKCACERGMLGRKRMRGMKLMSGVSSDASEYLVSHGNVT